AMPNGKKTAPEDLLRFADAAMYEAKRAGRGRAALANAALMAAADRQGGLGADGRAADPLAAPGARHAAPGRVPADSRAGRPAARPGPLGAADRAARGSPLAG